MFTNRGNNMNDNAQAAIHSYVTDMLALEQHIKSALEGQTKGFANTPAFLPTLQRLQEMRQVHIDALTALAERRKIGGQGIAGAVKTAAAAVLGMGAAAVDFVRTEELPKNLRDDYAETLQHVIHESVVTFLAEDGLSPRADVLPEIHRSVRAAWTSKTVGDGSHALPPTSDLATARPFATQRK
ncbi:MAG: hypothetical protein IT353_13665 [Gemmatimonadaceae bacterium]|nr:hypothetical protein [Gemmatimonadaceae bacterium]